MAPPPVTTLMPVIVKDIGSANTFPVHVGGLRFLFLFPQHRRSYVGFVDIRCET